MNGNEPFFTDDRVVMTVQQLHMEQRCPADCAPGNMPKMVVVPREILGVVQSVNDRTAVVYWETGEVEEVRLSDLRRYRQPSH